MRGYGQFCPVAVASEIFAERWTPLILRELFSGSRRFNEIRSGMPLISRTLLAQRLHQLEDAGVIDMMVHADVGALARVCAGHLVWADAVRSGGIRLEGPRAIVQAFPRWLQLSHFARVLQPTHAG
jgi:hypothetical protein